MTLQSTKMGMSEPPPEAWLPARQLARAVRGPIERFMHVSASSGIALLAAVFGLIARFGDLPKLLGAWTPRE